MCVNRTAMETALQHLMETSAQQQYDTQELANYIKTLTERLMIVKKSDALEFRYTAGLLVINLTLKIMVRSSNLPKVMGERKMTIVGLLLHHPFPNLMGKARSLL